MEVTARKRRPCFAGFVARIGNDRLPKTSLLGKLGGRARHSEGQEFDQPKRLQETLTVFGIVTSKKGWEASANKAEKWCDRIEVPGWNGSWTSGTQNRKTPKRHTA